MAAPGTSAHEYGLAFDLIVSPFEAISDVGAYWQQMGGAWGAAKDPVHFELPGASEWALQQGAREATPSLWDYVGVGLSLTDLPGFLLELGYVAASRQEAEKIARMLHVDPHGRVF